MVLEALAAVSLANAVLQFVDFTTRIISKGNKYYRSTDGVLSENFELHAIAENLKRLCKGLVESAALFPGPDRLTREKQALKKAMKASNSDRQTLVEDEQALKGGEQALKEVAVRCQTIAVELSTVIGRLKISGTRTKWRSFRQALKSQWKKEEINSTLQRLRLAREDLVIHLLVVIK